MSIRRLFPIVAWMGRRLISRPARLLYLVILLVVVVPAIALRIEAAVFEWRVHKVMAGLSSLRVGTTTKAEALSKIPELKIVSDPRERSYCHVDECLSIEIEDSKLSNWILFRVTRTDNQVLYLTLHWWGLRFSGYRAYVDFTSGKVVDFGYLLMVSTSRPGFPGDVMIGVSSERRIPSRGLNLEIDENPYYYVRHFHKAPEQNMSIYFTPEAPNEFVSHAFDLKLRCLHSLAGCSTANELLPEVERDKLRIQRAAVDRILGSNPCPDRILPHRARDIENILLVEVTSVNPTLMQGNSGSWYRLANLRLLRVLKGNASGPLDNIVIPSEIWFGEKKAYNSAIDLLNPGQKILFFSDSSQYSSQYIDEPCQAVAATDSAVQTIEKALNEAKP